MSSHRSNNLIIAGVLALLSYAPFKIVAQITLVLCLFLFVLDPFPPNSRLIAIIAVSVVHLLSKLEKKWNKEKCQEEREDDDKNPDKNE